MKTRARIVSFFLIFSFLSAGVAIPTYGAAEIAPNEIVSLRLAVKKYERRAYRLRRLIRASEKDLVRARKARTMSREKVVSMGKRLARVTANSLSLTAKELSKTKYDYKRYKTALARLRRTIPIREKRLAGARKSRAAAAMKLSNLRERVQRATYKEIGVGLPEAYNGLPALENKLGKGFDIYLHYQSLPEDFDTGLAEWLWQRGTKIQVAWEPHNPSKDPGNQPEYRLTTITNGNHDAAIYRWARQIKAFGHPVYFRAMCEMNGDWTAWGAYTNGNRPEDYIPAWRRVRDIFREVGADNAKFIWSPNRAGDDADAEDIFNNFYPGDSYVDYVGINGYNWGLMYDTPEWSSSWMGFAEVFGPSYRAAVRRTKKPVFIAEMATTEVGGDKAEWIRQAFARARADFPRIKAIVWFNYNKETDWRIDNNGANLEAFRNHAFN